MEQLTIKQLLDLGASIDIRFLDCETKEEAEAKVNSLGYDGKTEHREIPPSADLYGFFTYQTMEFYPVRITAHYGHKE